MNGPQPVPPVPEGKDATRQMLAQAFGHTVMDLADEEIQELAALGIECDAAKLAMDVAFNNARAFLLEKARERMGVAGSDRGNVDGT